MCDIVGWADYTSSMAAFEAALVIRSSIDRNLLAEKLLSVFIVSIQQLSKC